MNINLLPWREKKQQNRQRLFLHLALLLCIISIIASFYGYQKVSDKKQQQEQKIERLTHQLLALQKQVKSQILSSKWQPAMHLIQQWNRITQQHQKIHQLLRPKWQHLFPHIKVQQIQLSSSTLIVKGKALAIQKLHQFVCKLKKSRFLTSLQLSQISKNPQHDFDFLLQSSQP